MSVGQLQKKTKKKKRDPREYWEKKEEKNPKRSGLLIPHSRWYLHIRSGRCRRFQLDFHRFQVATKCLTWSGLFWVWNLHSWRYPKGAWTRSWAAGSSRGWEPVTSRGAVPPPSPVILWDVYAVLIAWIITTLFSIVRIESCFQLCQRELHYGLCYSKGVRAPCVCVVLAPSWMQSRGLLAPQLCTASHTVSQYVLFASSLNQWTSWQAELFARGMRKAAFHNRGVSEL